MKFKHGDRVTATYEIDDAVKKITDARISQEDGSPYFCSNEYSLNGSNSSNKLGYRYSWKLSLEYTDNDGRLSDIKLLSKLDNCNLGDSFTDEKNNKRTVLDLCDDTYLISNELDTEVYYTKEELMKISSKWTLIKK